MKGRFKAGESNNRTFKLGRGLKAKLEATGKRGIADGGHPGHPELLRQHTKQWSVKRFKSRGLKQHEKFNGLTKNFNCASGRCRHSVERFSQCFGAVCVTCQHQLETGNSLCDVLIDGTTEEAQLHFAQSVWIFCFFLSAVSLSSSSPSDEEGSVRKMDRNTKHFKCQICKVFSISQVGFHQFSSSFMPESASSLFGC
jgi:hypothetical protein